MYANPRGGHHMRMKNAFGACAATLLITTLVGCTGIMAGHHNEALRQMLPAREGFTWKYSGFVGYDHTMVLNTIQQVGSTTRYVISGKVGDPSGGEAQRDFTLKITYIIQDGLWIQEKQEEAMLDSDFDRIEILRGPIERGRSWSQKQTDQNGLQRTLVCTIEEVRMEDGMQVLRVKYQDRGSAYYEIREIRQGLGIVMFEKLWVSPDGDFEIGYHLYTWSP